MRKVSIIPRGQALGVTFSAPDADRFNLDERHLLAQIKVALGGRCAEEVVLRRPDNRRRIRYPASDAHSSLHGRTLGDEQRHRSDSRAALREHGHAAARGTETSEQTQQLVDQEVHRIVEAAHREVIELLHAKREQLDNLVAELMKNETLDEADAYAAAGLTRADAAVPELAINGAAPIGAVGMPTEANNED